MLTCQKREQIVLALLTFAILIWHRVCKILRSNVLYRHFAAQRDISIWKMFSDKHKECEKAQEKIKQKKSPTFVYV